LLPKHMKRWVLHDLRRTARSLMSRAGVQRDISERVMGHAIVGVEGVYDQYPYTAAFSRSSSRRKAPKFLKSRSGKLGNFRPRKGTLTLAGPRSPQALSRAQLRTPRERKRWKSAIRSATVHLREPRGAYYATWRCAYCLAVILDQPGQRVLLTATRNGSHCRILLA
jgi:hypothetical protein